MIATYRALFVSQLQLASQYRLSMFLYVFFSFIRPVIFLAAWIAVAQAQGGSVGGFDVRDLAGYFVVITLVTHLTQSWDFHEFEFEVRQGRLSPKLLRPLHPINYAIVQNVVWKLFTIVAVIPVAVAIAVTFDARFATEPWHAVVGTVSLALGAALYFTFGWVVACVAFWTTRVASVVTLYQRSAFIFAGQIAPLALLPGPLEAIAYALPFGYMLGVPADILRGGVDVPGAALRIAGQLVWLAISIVAYRAVWRAGLREYSAVGA